MAVLRTIHNVEILEVGEDWETSTGVFTFTLEDLQSAIASQEDPAVRTPILKLGHVDPRFDGEPALGRVVNLRLSENGQTLVCDLTGVPAWLAEVMGAAFPRRSIEGQYEFRTRTGNTWPFVLTALSLLGTAYPAINTLEDLELLWGDEAPALVPVEDVPELLASSGNTIRAARVGDMVTWKTGGPPTEEEAMVVRAAVAVSDVVRSYYDTLTDDQFWWWVREVRIDPAELIVDPDDGSGELYRVPYAISGDTVTYSDPVKVKIEYVDVAASAGAGRPVVPVAAGQRVMASYAAPEKTGREGRPAQESVRAADSPGTVPSDKQQKEGASMALSEEALRALGLEPGASDADVEAAILASLQERNEDPNGDEVEPEAPTTVTDPEPHQPETPANDPAANPSTAPAEPVEVPEGMVLVDASVFEQVRRQAEEGAAVAASIERQRRDGIVEAAVRAGKFPRSVAATYRQRLDEAPQAWEKAIAEMPAIMPVGVEVGSVGGEVAASEADAYDPAMLPKSVVRARGRSAATVRVVND